MFSKINSKISSKAIFYFSLIFIINVILGIYLYSIIKQQTLANAIVDMAGKNRMFSQRIQGMLIVLNISESEEVYKKAKTEITNLLQKHDVALTKLKNGGTAPGNEELVFPEAEGELKDSVEKVIAFFETFKGKVNFILKQDVFHKKLLVKEATLDLNTQTDSTEIKYNMVIEDLRKSFFAGVLLKKNQNLVDLVVKEYTTSTNTNIFLAIIFLTSLILIVVCGFIITNSLKPVADITNNINTLSEGKIATELSLTNKNEIGQIASSLNKLIKEFNNISIFAQEVGESRFDKAPELFNNKGDLALALNKLKNDLQLNKQLEEQRNWINEGAVKIGELLANANSSKTVNDFYNDLLNFVLRYTGAYVGTIYTLVDDEKKPFLQLKASSDLGESKKIKLDVGEGLLGNVIITKEHVYVNNLPTNFYKVESGIGEKVPTDLLIVPFKFNDSVNGAIEILSFTKLPQYKVDFILKIAESIFIAVDSFNRTSKTNDMLIQLQQQAEEMKAQEEELRQNMEEMQVIQEETEKKTEIYLSQIEELSEEIKKLKN